MFLLYKYILILLFNQIQGLSNSWDFGLIYASPITSRLLLQKYDIYYKFDDFRINSMCCFHSF